MTCRNYLVVVLCAACFLIGCGPSGPKKYPISGEVTFEGTPVVDGMIHFRPDSAKGNAGPPGYAVIKEGKYSTSGKHSVMGGPYYAMISGYAEPHAGGEIDPRKPIFDEIIKAIDIPKEASNFDFHLTKDDLTKRN